MDIRQHRTEEGDYSIVTFLQFNQWASFDFFVLFSPWF